MSAIFKDDLSSYSVSRLDSLSTSTAGEQMQNRSSHSFDLAVYDKGTKSVKQLAQDSYTLATIHIYSDPKTLNMLDDVTYNSLIYTVIELKHGANHSFYRAVCNV